MLKYTMTNDSIMVVVDGESHTCPRGNANFDKLQAALLAGDDATAKYYLSMGHMVDTWARGSFLVKDGQICCGDDPLPESLSGRILSMVTADENPQPLLNFWTKLAKNPSWRSVQQLWTFLAHKGIPLTEDGCFLAYKAVNANWTDVHTGTESNVVGSAHEMPRNRISDDPNEACHYGFHVGALAYAQGFCPSEGKLLICKVDPADVVCVPYDCSAQKMRVCRYEVLGVYGMQLPDTIYNTAEDPACQPDDDEEEEDLEEDLGDYPLDDVDLDDEEEETCDCSCSKAGFSFSTMDRDELMAQTMDVLRGYAAKTLKIVGASKLPGGKAALVQRIIEVR